MGDITSPTFLNGSLQLVTGGDPNNSTSDTNATDNDIIHGSDISSNDYAGRFIAVSDDYLFVSKNPSTGTNNNVDDLVSRSYITVFRFNEDGTQTQVTTIPQPTQYEPTSSHGYSRTWVGSMSVDKDYLLVGCPNHKMLRPSDNVAVSYSGAIAIYKRDIGAETWSLKQFIEEPNAQSSGYFGLAVAISDGYMAVTNGNRISNNTTVTRDTVTNYDGSVFIYKKDNAENWNLLDRIRHPPAENNMNNTSNWDDHFGNSLEMDGEWLAIADPDRKQNYKYSSHWSDYQLVGHSGNIGTVFLYKRDTTSSTHFALKSTIFQKSSDQQISTFETRTNSYSPSHSNSHTNMGALGSFGTSISLYKNTLMVGTSSWYWNNSNSTGAIYIYNFNNQSGIADLEYMFGGDAGDAIGLSVCIYKNRAICSRYYKSILTLKKINNVWKYQTMITKNGWFTSNSTTYGGGTANGGIWHRSLKLNDKSIFTGDFVSDITYNNTGGVYRFPFKGDKNHLVLTFNENLRQDVNIDKTDFALQDNYINKPISNTKIESGLVKIEPKTDIEDERLKKLAITYTKNATSGTPLDVGDTVSIFTTGSSLTSPTTYFRPEYMTHVGSDYYVTDQNNNKIWKITYDGIVTHFSGSSATSSSSGTTVGTATNARYNNPCDIVSDGTYLFVADHNNNRIIRVGLDGTSENFVGSTGNSSGYVDATGTSARFYYPKGLVIDSAKKHLYVCDNQNNRIRKINIETKQVTTIAGGGPPENSDGIGAAAKIPYPNVLVITKYDRYLYVGEFGSKLRKIDLSDNNVTTIDTSPWGGSHPYPTAIDLNGEYIYITGESYEAHIYRLKVSDDTITLFAGNGNGNSGTVGALLSTEFSYPGKNRIFIDNNFNLLITEEFNNKILKIASTGGSKNIMDIAGNAVDSFTHNFDDIKPTHTTTEIVSGSFALSFSETIKDNANIDANDFSVIFEGVAQTISSVEISDGKVLIEPEPVVTSYSGTTWTQITTSPVQNSSASETGAPTGATNHNVEYFSGGDGYLIVIDGWNSYGSSSGSYTDDTFALNLQTNQWTKIVDGSTGRAYSACCLYGNFIYKHGGYSPGNVSKTYKLDLSALNTNNTSASFSWTQVHDGSNGPGYLNLHCLFHVPNTTKLISVWGAKTGSVYSDEIWLFDTTNNSWSEVTVTTPSSSVLVAGSSVLYNNKIYVAGGYSGVADTSTTNGIVNTVFVMDLSNLLTSNEVSWSELTTTGVTLQPWARSDPTGWLHDGKMYVFGGGNWDTTPRTDYDILRVLDLNTYEWSIANADTKPSSRYDANGAVVENKLIFYGGNDYNSSTGNQFEFDLWKYELTAQTKTIELCDVEITYTKNVTSNKNITDRAVNAVDTFTYSSTKRAAYIDFSIKHTSLKSILNIGFTGYIRDNANISKDDFTITLNGSVLAASGIEEVKTENGAVSITLANKITEEKEEVSIAYVKSATTNQNIIGMNNFPVKSFTILDTVKPLINDIFTHYSTITVGTAVGGQTYRETNKSFVQNNGNGKLGQSRIEAAGDYIMVREYGNKRVYIYYYDGTDWNEQKEITYTGSFGNFNLTENYAFVNFVGAATDRGEVKVYKRDGTTWNDFQTIIPGDLRPSYVNYNHHKIGSGILAYKDYLILTCIPNVLYTITNGIFIFKMKPDNSAYEIHSVVAEPWIGVPFAIGGERHDQGTGEKSSMAMNDKYLCVSVLLDFYNNTNNNYDKSGHCNIYKKLENGMDGWMYYKRLEPILTSSNASYPSIFGCSVRMNDRFLVIGQKSQKYDTSVSHQGAVHIYDIYNDFKLVKTISPGLYYDFGFNTYLNKDNVLVIGGSPGNSNKESAIYKYNGIDWVEINKLKKLGYNLDNSNTGNDFGFSCAITNNTVVVSEPYANTNKGIIHSAILTLADRKIIEVCFTKAISANANIDKDDFTVKTDGVANPIVSITINNGKLSITVTNNIVNKNSVELTYTKNASASKNIKSNSLDVESFGTKATPSSYTLQNKNFTLSGMDIVNNNKVRKSNEHVDFPSSWQSPDDSESLYMIGGDDLIFTYCKNTSNYQDEYGGDGWGKSIPSSYSNSSFVIMYKKMNNVWTKLHRFTGWNRTGSNQYPHFGYSMVYYNGYLAIGAPGDMGGNGRIYLVKYNSTINLMEQVGYYDGFTSVSTTGGNFGQAVTMDDKYVYGYGTATQASGTKDYGLWIFSINDMSLVYQIPNVKTSINGSLGNYTDGDLPSYNNIKSFKVKDNYYVMTTRKVSKFQSRTGIDTYIVILFKKHEINDTWSLFQILFPSNVNACPHIHNSEFGVRVHLGNHRSLAFNDDSNEIYIGAVRDPTFIHLNGINNYEHGVGCVFVFNYDDTTGKWGNTDLLAAAGDDTSSKNIILMSDKVSYPDDAITDIDLGYSTSDKEQVKFGHDIVWDNYKKRLIINSYEGKYPNIIYKNSSCDGTITMYKKFNKKYYKIGSSVLNQNLMTSNASLSRVLQTNTNGDIYVGQGEDVQIMYGTASKTYVIEFSNNIYLGKKFDKNSLTLKYEAVDIDVESVLIENNKMLLISYKLLEDINKVYISYTPSNDSEKNILSEHITIDAFTNGDITVPVYSSMALFMGMIELTFTKNIGVNNEMLFQDFQVFSSNIEQNIKTISVSNGKLYIKLLYTILNIDAIEIKYYKNTTKKYNLMDENGVSVADFSQKKLTTTPTFSSLAEWSGKVELTFTESIMDNVNIDKDDFSLTLLGTNRTIVSAEVWQGKVIINTSAIIDLTTINDVVVTYRKNQLVSKNIINIAGTPVNTFITSADSTAPVVSSIVNYVEEATVYGVPFGESYNTVSELSAYGETNSSYMGTTVRTQGDYMFASRQYSNGKIYVYKYISSSWTLIKEITPSDHSTSDYFGVAFDVYGDYLVAGSPADDDAGSNTGSLYIFKRNEGGADNWGEIKKIPNPGYPGETINTGQIGFYSVAIYGDYIVGGCKYQKITVNGSLVQNAGAAYIFRKDEGGSDNWGLIHSLKCGDITSSGSVYFGGSVSISDDVLVIGAKEAIGYGAAYVYIRTNTTWNYSERLIGDDKKYGGAGSPSYNGMVVETDGKKILSHAVNGEVSGAYPNSGIVFLYVKNAQNKFIEKTAFGAVDSTVNWCFGRTLAMNNDTICIGAFGDNTVVTNGGSVSIFKRHNGGINNWGLAKIIRRGMINDDGNDRFATGHTSYYTKALAIDKYIFVGSYDYDPPAGSTRGGVWNIGTTGQITYKNKIILNSTDLIKDVATYSANDFVVQGHDGVKTVTSVDVINNELILTLSGEISNVNRVLVIYTKNANAGQNVKNTSDIDLESFTIGDIVPPVFQSLANNSAGGSNYDLELIFDENIANNANISKDDFTFKINNVLKDIVSATVSNGKVLLRHTETIANINDVEVGYIKNDLVAQNITDAVGNPVITFNNVSPTVESITHTFQMDVNIGKVVSGEDYRDVNGYMVYNEKNLTTEYKAWSTMSYQMGRDHFSANSEWMCSYLDYKFHVTDTYAKGAVVIYKRNSSNPEKYDFYQFIPHPYHFDADGTRTTNSSSWHYSHQYFGYNCAINENYMIAMDNYSTDQYYLYTLTNNVWTKIEQANTLTGNDNPTRFLLTDNNYMIQMTYQNTSVDDGFIKIKKMDSNGTTGSTILITSPPDANKYTNAKYWPGQGRGSTHGTTLIVGHKYAARYPYTGSTTDINSGPCDRGEIYIYEENKGGVGAWGLQKRVVPPQAWYDITTNGSNKGVFGMVYAVYGDILVVMAGEESEQNSDKHKIIVYYRNEGGDNNWGFKKMIDSPTLTYASYWANNITYWQITVKNKYIAVSTHAEKNQTSDSQYNGSAWVWGKDVGGTDNWGFIKQIKPEVYPDQNQNLSNYQNYSGYFGYRLAFGYGYNLLITSPQWHDTIGGTLNAQTKCGKVSYVRLETETYHRNKVSVNTSEVLKDVASYNPADFTVEDHVGVKTVTAVDISSNSIILTVNTDINDINRALVTYTKDTSNPANNIRDLMDYKMDSFTSGDITSPVYSSRSLLPSSVSLGISEPGTDVKKANSIQTISNKEMYLIPDSVSNPGGSDQYTGMVIRGDYLIYYGSVGPYSYNMGMSIYKYENGQWKDSAMWNRSNYRLAPPNFYSNTKSYYFAPFSESGNSQIANSYNSVNANRYFGNHGLFWFDHRNNYNKGPALKLISNNKLFFDSHKNDCFDIDNIINKALQGNYQDTFKCCAYGSDWLVLTENSTTFYFAKYDTTTNNLEKKYQVSANTFMDGSSMSISNQSVDYRAYINNDYYIIVKPSDDTPVYSVWKRQTDDSWTWLSRTTKTDLGLSSSHQFGRNAGGVLYKNYYVDHDYDGYIYVHELVNNTRCKLSLPLGLNNNWNSDNHYRVPYDMTDDYIVVGNSNNDEQSTNNGAVFIFMKNSDNTFGKLTNGVYYPNTKVFPNDATANLWFGNSVQIHQSTGNILVYTKNYTGGGEITRRKTFIIEKKTLYGIRYNFSDDIKENINIDKNDFTQIYNNNDITIETVNINNGNVDILFEDNIADINNSGIIYDKNTNTSKNFTDLQGNPVLSFALTNSAPLMESFELYSSTINEIAITHSRKMKNTTYNINDYEVKEGSSTISVSSINVIDKIIKLNMSTNITNIELVKITYTKSNVAAENVKDIHGNNLLSGYIGSTELPAFIDATLKTGGNIYGMEKVNKSYNVPNSYVNTSGLTPSPSGFGQSMASSGDYLFVASPYTNVSPNNYNGNFYVYKWTGTEYEYKSNAAPSMRLYNSGNSESIHAEGDYVLLHSPQGETNRPDGNGQSRTGNAFIFKKGVGEVWVEETMLYPTDNGVGNEGMQRETNNSAAYTYFGYSASMGGDWVAVGCPGEKSIAINNRNASNDYGAVWLWKNDGGTWTQKQRINGPDSSFTSSNIQNKSYFGDKVFIKGNYLLISHPQAYNPTNGSYYKQGVIWIYKLNNGSWEYLSLITLPSDKFQHPDNTVKYLTTQMNSLGNGIYWNGDYLIISSNFQSNKKNVNIFKFNNTTTPESFDHQKQIFQIGNYNNGRFGTTNYINNDYALISNEYNPASFQTGGNPGEYYIYKREGTDWNYQDTIAYDSDAGRAYFSRSLLIHGDRFLSGNYNNKQVSITINGPVSYVELSFNQTISTNENLSTGDFEMIYDSTVNTINSVEIVSGKLHVKSDVMVTDLSNVKLTYTKNASAAQNLKNSNGNTVDSFIYRGKTTKPTFDSLTVSTNQTPSNGLYTSTIELTFSDLLLQNNNIDKTDFSAEYGGSPTTVHTAVISSGKVQLTVKIDNNAVADSDFFLTYTKNTNTTKNIGDGMDNYVDTFNYIPGFAFRDTTISNGKISLNWTTPLNDTVSIDKDDFIVTIDGEPEIITSAEISTKSVLLTSTNTITDASLVRATYTKNTTASKNLKSLADNEIVETFSTSPEPATLSTTTIGGNANPNKIYLNWDSVSTTNKSRFSKHNFILRNHRGKRIRFNSIETAGSGQITLTSSQNLIGGNRYFLSYKRDFMRNNRIRDVNNRIVDSFWNRPIYTNNITQPNITIESATVNNATPTKILIDLNTEVTIDNKVGMPFTVTCRGSNNLLKSTIVASYNIINTNNENYIELTTNRTFINGDKILLNYTKPVIAANQIKGSNSGLPNSSRTYNYTVTASNGAFNINGDSRKLLYLNRGDIYVFNLSHSSLTTHPFKLSLTNNGSHNSGVEYTEGVTLNGTYGQTGANLTFVVPVDAPGNLYYYCSNHSGMGSRIFCSGTVINTMLTTVNYDVKNKVGPALFSDFKKMDVNIGSNYGFTENVHSINTGEELGKSVEIDSDYSIIGGPGNNRVLINYFSNNAWAQQKELTGQNSSDKFGISVAISGDTAVVGASNYNSNKGKIYIYKRTGTSWNSEQTIEGEGSDDYFGHSVSIDGDTIVTSANEKGSNDFGKIYIYKRSGTTWSLEHNITGSVNNDKIGEKVVVKGDVMAYSTSSHSEHRGNVVIYNRSGSTWSKTEDIVGTKANEKIGKSLSLDTNTLLVGNPDANTVFMYEYANSEWTRTEEFENTDSTNFGSSVDIDIANNKLVIGADSDTVNGKIYVYEKENSVWNTTQDFIGETSGDNYGKDVSISNNRILSSAPNKAKTGGGASAGKFYYHKLLTTERLEVTFDDNLKSRPGIDKDDFVLESDGNANTIEKVYISNGKLIINHQTLITDTNTIVLTYIKNVDATKNLLDLDGNAIITFTYPEGPSVEQSGIGTIQLRTKVTTVVPTSITKTNGIFDFRNLTQDKGVKTVVDDTPVKKRLRTRTFIRDIFKELKKKDTSFNSKSGSTKINKNLLAFTEKVSKRVHETVRLYDADSTIDMRSITKGESIYIPLETNESVVISLPNTTIGGGTTDYTFTKNANDTTTISPALDGKDTVNDDDVIIHGDYNVAIGSIVVGDNPLHLHIPFIFDVSGNLVVYGEKVVDTQYYTARHEFTAGDPTSSLTADKLKDLYFYSDETENYAVTVLAGKFALNGESEKVLRLQKGVRYIFDLSDATNNTHPFKFSTTKNGTHNGGSEYVTGVRSYGTPGSPDSAVEFFISTNAPAELFYYCGAHSGSGDYGMGSSIKISDKAAMFYRGSDISSNIVKDALHADLCSNTSNIKHDTTHSKVATKSGDYNPPITSTSGNSLGNILVRYIATHLMSHPLAQAFITNDDSIENDVNGTGQNQSKIAETLITQFNDNLVADGTTPRKNQVIQSLFEQMIAGDINRFMVGDDSGKQPIPFKTGDKLVFYVNMKAKLAIESNAISPATPISLVELFPNSIYPLLDDSNGELDAGLWKIVLTIS